MKILVLTVFLSLCLAGMFLVFFIQDRRRQSDRSLEQDALLPFNEEPLSSSASSPTREEK